MYASPNPASSHAATSPRRLSNHCRCESEIPTPMPTSPMTTEPSTCPIPHSAVIHSVRRRVQSRAADMATNGR